ncbi:uncharacterized protein LOC109712690 isoform X2 [Ananas comosus]|uniref:Uncharacterized protein LOC109712690 isoform X2 n=1 Tax=Ananas comosus TaxID=4615 RepID=A0A6P5F745_ANACO|nr:uncharacterized protein LOC109712690 isoform X2 [Ananas comosus]
MQSSFKLKLQGGWLGIIARKPNLCPIHYPSWNVMPLMFKTKLLLLTRGTWRSKYLDVTLSIIFLLLHGTWKSFKFISVLGNDEYCLTYTILVGILKQLSSAHITLFVTFCLQLHIHYQRAFV